MFVCQLGALAAAEPWLEGQAKNDQLREYTSVHFRLRTDLDDEAAGDLLGRMERSIKACALYWGQDVRRPIEAFVVSDLNCWRSADFPHPLGKILIHRVGGAVDLRNVRDGRRSVRESVLYAAAVPGVAEHEVVHAYCSQVFGTSGPGWYREGMAELANNRDLGSSAIRCPLGVLDELRSGVPRPISSIVRNVTMGDSIFEMLSDLGQRRRSGKRLTRAEKRELERGRAVDEARRSYCWSWSLCHFLDNNPNYKQRFRALGKAYLNQQRVSFDQAFAGVADELKFEYAQFLRHVDNGYRVDLCSWRWDRRHDSLSPKETLRVRVRADYGFQPTGLTVVAGQEYQFHARGVWRVKTGDQAVSADGDAQQWGQLVGVILSQFELSPAIDLGEYGVFTAPSDGHLYLRCRDHWSQLSDNEGFQKVLFSRKDVE